LTFSLIVIVIVAESFTEGDGSATAAASPEVFREIEREDSSSRSHW